MNENVIVKNIFYMLTYVFNEVDKYTALTSSSEEFENIDDMFSRLLVSLVNSKVKRGIYKEYKETSEQLSSPKGRIDFNQSIRSNGLFNKKADCDFDEYSEDNILNQIIKKTLEVMLINEFVHKDTKNKIILLLRFFEGVSRIDIKLLNTNRITFNRQTDDYRFILYICNLYIKRELFGTEGETKIDSLVNDDTMHIIFEKFVRNYFKTHYKESNSRSIIMRWNINDTSTLLPIMKTDTNLSGNDHELIIDTKYYSSMYQSIYGTDKIISAHLYQIYAYVDNYSRKHNMKTSGMVLYAKTKNQDNLNFHEKINGHEIYFKSINLDGNFEELKKQLNEISDILYL